MRFEIGGPMPNITVGRLDGRPFAYEDIWQKQNLLLVALDPQPDEKRAGEEAAWVSALLSHDADLRLYDAVAVVTRDRVPGLQPTSAVVADRWGEIIAIEQPQGTGLPPVADLIEDLRFVAHACPECEGETR